MTPEEKKSLYRVNGDGDPLVLPPPRPSKTFLGRLDASLKRHMPTLWITFKVVVVLLLVLLVMLLLFIAWNNYQGTRELDAARADAKTTGRSLSMQELIAELPSVSEDQNAANLYEKAFLLLDKRGVRPGAPFVPFVSVVTIDYRSTDVDKQKALQRDHEMLQKDPAASFPAYMLEASIKYLDERRDVLDLLEKASSMPLCRYHLLLGRNEWYVPRLGTARSAARVMALSAWVSAEEGNGPEAISRIRQALAIARSLEDEPFAGLTGRAVMYITIAALPRVLARVDLPDSALEPLQDDLQALADGASVRPLAASELARFCDFADPVVRGQVSLRSLLKANQPWIDISSMPGFTMSRLPAWCIRGQLKRDEARTMRFLLDFYDRADNSSPGLLPTQRPPVTSTDMALYPLFCMETPSFARYANSPQETRAKLASTAACIAALRYKNDHGSWPDSLDALVPDYISAVPIDPFSGEPPTYLIDQDSISVVFVGKGSFEIMRKPPSFE